uniref:Uncharacterized protein n=1 Tax=Hyaloperonospora arabidopsidis (strain Emoy2) TaxID=559515 RepID=M4B5K9_HYAAE
MGHVAGAFEDELRCRAEVMAPTSTSSSSRFDLLWGSASHEMDGQVFSSSTTSRDSARGRASSTGSTFMLPPPPTMAKAVTFPMPGARNVRETSATDLLSFSPVLTSAPADPFFGIDDNTSETSTAAPAFENNDIVSTTSASTLSTTFSLAPMSLFTSFESLHDDGDTLGLSDATPGTTEGKASPRDPFVKHMTRSFGSLSSSSISARTVGDDGSKNEAHSLLLQAVSPSHTPTFWQGSSKSSDGFAEFVSGADNFGLTDPFAEADLATSQVSLEDHLSAWSIAADLADDEKEDEDSDSKQTCEEDSKGMQKPVTSTSDDDIGNIPIGDGCSDIDLAKTTETEDLVDAFTATRRCEDGERFAVSFENGHMATNVSIIRSAAAVVLNESDIQTADVTADSEHKALDLRDNILSDLCEHNRDVVAFTKSKNAACRVEQKSMDAGEGSLECSQTGIFLLTSTSADLNAGIASPAERFFDDIANEESCIQPHGASHSTSPVAPMDIPITSEPPEKNTALEANMQDGQIQARVADRVDGFDDFNDFGAAAVATSIPNASFFGAPPSPAHKLPADDGFGDFAVSTSASMAANVAPVDDDFGDFVQNVNPSGDDDCFGDFGDFEQVPANTEDSFTDFQQSSAAAFEGSEGDFGDPLLAVDSLRASSLSKAELSTFFKEAFPAERLPAISVDKPESPTAAKTNDFAQELPEDFVRSVYRGMWDEFISAVAVTDHTLSPPSGLLASSAESIVDEEHVEKKTKYASKYLKYVLSEKIHEASRQNGILTNGSESHQMYVDIAVSGNAERMCAALGELQDALFHGSVNDAMMRIAKQAAISAKAKIAEQAAQQHANSRGGSLFFTTRHLLSRGGNSGGMHGPGSSGTDSKADHAVSDTPTGASVQKLARFSHAAGHNDLANGNRGVNREDRVSDGSDHTGHSSGSDSEVAASGVENQTRSPTLSNSGSSNGGLMKKFQDRFSFTSSRYRPRFVNLRRKGESGEEVRKMELNLDAISGGLDEVKWKCALFLYDVEEVTHVAPSQICIVAYPSKQPLSGKSDRSALTKLVKPGTIWTIDIGSNNSDVLNEW